MVGEAGRRKLLRQPSVDDRHDRAGGILPHNRAFSRGARRNCRSRRSLRTRRSLNIPRDGDLAVLARVAICEQTQRTRALLRTRMKLALRAPIVGQRGPTNHTKQRTRHNEHISHRRTSIFATLSSLRCVMSRFRKLRHPPHYDGRRCGMCVSSRDRTFAARATAILLRRSHRTRGHASPERSSAVTTTTSELLSIETTIFARCTRRSFRM